MVFKIGEVNELIRIDQKAVLIDIQQCLVVLYQKQFEEEYNQR